MYFFWYILLMVFILVQVECEHVVAPTVKDPEGYKTHTPENCCVTCGRNYYYNFGRCLYDPNKFSVALQVDDANFYLAYQPYQRSCCHYCGVSPFEFRYTHENGCVKLDQTIETENSFSSMRCDMCRFLVMDILASNTAEDESTLDVSWFRKCNIFYSDKTNCINFLKSNYKTIIDQTKNPDTLKQPHNYCFDLKYCETSIKETRSDLKRAILALTFGHAKLHT